MIRKILFVDDDQILQLAIEKRLAAFSDQFSVVLANDGFDALKVLEKTPVSLICMDLVMPRMDGMSLLNHVRANFSDIPVIIVSSMELDNLRQLAEVEGVVGFFRKPFDADQLGRKIVETLQREAKSGIMHNVSPTMFMQLMEMEGKTCTIRMLDNKSGDGGILYLKDGRLLDARVGKNTGMDAAYRVFAWDEVTLFLRNECEPRENRINSELQSIIMGALAAKDEEDESDLGNEEGSPVAGPFGGDDDDDLGLPTAFLGNGEEHGLDEALADHDDLGKADGALGEIRELLESELGSQEAIDAIYSDQKMTAVTDSLDKIGELSGIGAIKAFCVMAGDRQRMVIPGAPATVLDIGRGFAIEKALRVLQMRK